MADIHHNYTLGAKLHSDAQNYTLGRTTLWAELHSDEQKYTFDPLSDVTRSNWLQVALMSSLPIGIGQYPTDMPSP